MIILENEVLYIEINELGAEIRKVVKDGKSRMWTGDPAWWAGVAPVLFPICSGLPGNQYTYQGKSYTLNQHGFARKSVFEVESYEKETATFVLKANEETLKQYPWQFELQITYTLIEDQIKVEYKVTNRSEETMYYSIGSHEAYACPEGIESYDVVFEREEKLYNHLLEDGPVFSGKTEPILEQGNVLPLKEAYFETNALIFKNIQSRKASLVHRVSGQTTTVTFPECEYMLLWQPYGAPFICIEPWQGICSTRGDSGDITQKEGIMPLSRGAERLHTHIIEYK